MTSRTGGTLQKRIFLICKHNSAVLIFLGRDAEPTAEEESRQTTRDYVWNTNINLGSSLLFHHSASMSYLRRLHATKMCVTFYKFRGEILFGCGCKWEREEKEQIKKNSTVIRFRFTGVCFCPSFCRGRWEPSYLLSLIQRKKLMGKIWIGWQYLRTNMRWSRIQTRFAFKYRWKTFFFKTWEMLGCCSGIFHYYSKQASIYFTIVVRHSPILCIV